LKRVLFEKCYYKRRMNMPDRRKDFDLSVPVEKHDTAAWANVEKKKAHSQVTMPSEFQLINAKEYVDENEK
jgi:hypothetical protein